MRLVVRGARGSMPMSGESVRRFGGFTTCYSADVGDGVYLVVDCGTGLERLDSSLPKPGSGWEFHILLTHYHFDHLMGLPFFDPLYDERNRFTFYGVPWEGMALEEAVLGGFRPPWFPLALADTPSQKEFVELDGSGFAVRDVRVDTRRLNHPQGVTAYRLAADDAGVVIATDHEDAAGAAAALTDFARGAAVLAHDAQYLPEDYEPHRGWGHSTWEHAAAVAAAAEVDRLVLVSHDPGRSDDEIDAAVTAAQAVFPATEAAFEGMELEL